MINNYSKYINIKSLLEIIDDISDKFWKMTEIANWQDFINVMKQPETIFSKEIEKVQGRVFKNFEYNDIIIFEKEYGILYDYLYHILYKIIIKDKQDNKIHIGDDSYTDLISSIIAFGKEFIKNAIKNKDIIKNMILEENYYENFLYILHINKNKYHNIRCKYDPIYCDITKYNL